MTFFHICGLTNFKDGQLAAEAVADYLGFIFYEKSPRKADPEAVARIMDVFWGEDRYRTLVGVGVFVSPAADEVKGTLKGCQLKAAQIHKLSGDELRVVRQVTYGAAFAAVQPRSLPEALTALDLLNPETGTEFRTPGWCPQLLIDAYPPALHGGTGQRADFDVARELATRVPRLVLAGGLTPDNVGEAVRTVKPWAVDVAS